MLIFRAGATCSRTCYQTFVRGTYWTLRRWQLGVTPIAHIWGFNEGWNNDNNIVITGIFVPRPLLSLHVLERLTESQHQTFTSNFKFRYETFIFSEKFRSCCSVFFVQGFDLCVWLMPLLIIKCCHFPLATKTKLNCVSPLYKFVEHFARFSPRKACLKKWGDGQRCNIHLIPNGLRVEKQKSWIFTMG